MHISTAGHKTICVPVASVADYQTLIRNGRTFRGFLDDHIAAHPELFPVEIANGYWLHDTVCSKKLNLITRRIKLVSTRAVYQVRPDFVLPYMVGLTDEVEKALYPRALGYPLMPLTMFLDVSRATGTDSINPWVAFLLWAPPSKLPTRFRFI